jgi:nifR3 family TIM-barrel protein
MNQGFWEKLKKPIMALAPMADVTDAAFRRLIAEHGKPDVMFTEFTSADGLFLGGRDALMVDLAFTKKERPIVAQFFTSKPEFMEKAAALALELGFDGVDINMGCPDKSVEKQGAGAALIKTPALAREIIRAAKRGVEDKIPVSIKTRIGYKIDELDSWLPELLAEEPAAITLHARTRKEMSDVPARWDMVAKAVAIRNKLKSETLILGNGDLTDLSDAIKKVKESGADGAMLGRAIFGNPWLFANLARVKHERQIEHPSVSQEEKIKMVVEHSKLYEKLFKGVKNFAIMKKHFKAYVSGWEGAKDLRARLMEASDSKEVSKIGLFYLKTGKILD